MLYARSHVFIVCDAVEAVA